MTDNDYVFRKLSSPHYKHEVPLIALNEYRPDSHGEHDFSRKQAWFYVYGDSDIKQEFESGLVDLIDQYFADDDTDWDLMTLYPTHVEGEVNPNLRDLMMDVISDTDINMEQVLKRNKTVQESHEIQDEKAKVVNLQGSIEVDRDLKGRNVILVDNIALSGISILHGVNRLKQRGADKVFALCIGAKIDGKDARTPGENLKATQLL